MGHGHYTLLVEDDDTRAKVMEQELGDTKQENPVLRARTVCEALRIIQDSDIGSINTLVFNPTVWLLSRGEKWGSLGPLYLRELKANNGRTASWPLFFSMLSSLYPNLKTEPGLIGKSNLLLSSLSPKANEETRSVSEKLHQFQTRTRQMLAENNTWDNTVIKEFIGQIKLN